MRIALISANTKSVVYPLGLMKIAAWRKSLGDSVQLFENEAPRDVAAFDAFWISVVFTFDLLGAARIAKSLPAGKVRAGGVAVSLFPDVMRKAGADVHVGLLAEAENQLPDYSILGKPVEYAIAHTSRGCVRKCSFCMVPRLEPAFADRPEWPTEIPAGTKAIRFFDNNFLAKPIESIRRDARQIAALRAAGLRHVDFNQGLDARLLDDERADILAGIIGRGSSSYPCRFAFDNMSEDGYFQRAVEKMAARGVHSFSYYALYNFTDTPADLYYRLRQTPELIDRLGVQVVTFPMRYHPISQLDFRRQYVGPHWTAKTLVGFTRFRDAMSVHGTISPHPQAGQKAIAEFEYYFGKTAEEFKARISFPKSRAYAEMLAAKWRNRNRPEV